MKTNRIEDAGARLRRNDISRS